jgi:putative glutamine amidotransferase
MPNPLIAVSPNHMPAEVRRLYQGKPLEYGEAELAAGVARAGGLPVMVYRAEREADDMAAWATLVMGRVDGLVLSGGVDISPGHYGEVPGDPAWAGDPLRDALELALYRAAVSQGKPVLGVCRGAQLIGVAEGGRMWQDLETRRGAETPTLVHRSQAEYDRHGHPLELVDDRFLGPIFEGEPRYVNSVHHQALRDVPRSLRVLARAPDGVPECYVRDDAWVLGVQWHPEWMAETASHARIFGAFIGAASKPNGRLPW